MSLQLKKNLRELLVDLLELLHVINHLEDLTLLQRLSETLLAVFSVVLSCCTYTALSSLSPSPMVFYGVCSAASSELLRLPFFSGWESFLRGDECEVLTFICVLVDIHYL